MKLSNIQKEEFILFCKFLESAFLICNTVLVCRIKENIVSHLGLDLIDSVPVLTNYCNVFRLL